MPDKGRSQKDLSPQVEHECGSTAGKAFDLFFVSFINEDVVVSVPFMNIEQMEIYKYNTNRQFVDISLTFKIFAFSLCSSSLFLYSSSTTFLGTASGRLSPTHTATAWWITWIININKNFLILRDKRSI